MNLTNLKLVVRNLYRNRLLSVLNISGLATGLAVVILIFNYTVQEFLADGQHKKLDDIYVVQNQKSARVQYEIATLLRDHISGIKYVTMVESQMRDWFVLKNRDNLSIKTDVVFADSSFTKIFSFIPVFGNLENALNEPGSVILVKSEASRLFGVENPIGKVLSLKSNYDFVRETNVEVKAVINDLPDNSNLQFKAVVSHSTKKKITPFGCYWCPEVQNYVLLEKGLDPKELTSRINQHLKTLIPKEVGCNFSLLPYRDAYFSNIEDNFKHGKLKLIYILSSLALLVLFIAGINYINLSIAASIKRLVEVGLKKIIGARQNQLIIQFLGESVLVCAVSMLLGVLLACLVTPFVNQLSAIQLPAIPLCNIRFWLILIFCSVLLGIMAGLLPALSFNNYGPISLITGRLRSRNHDIPKHALMVFQFTVAIILIICTLSVTRQLYYCKNTSMGFNSENVVNFTLSPEIKQREFKEKLINCPGVESVSISAWYPGCTSRETWENPLVYNGIVKKVVYAPEFADANFTNQMGLKFVLGRNFSDSLKSDNGTAILNEAAVRAFGLEKPLDAYLQLTEGEINRIIGVVKDFNFESFQKEIRPLVIFHKDMYFFRANVKLSSGSFDAVSGTLARIGKIWNEASPSYPFDFVFIDQEIQNLYKSEMIFEQIFRYSSLFAIFISCLGLFGLAVGSTERRRKEIGIRKVNGAKIVEVLFMINKDFIKCVIIAFVIAAPVAWLLMHKWLENYAYKIPLSWWIFVLAGVMALCIALLTVSWQSWKAATRNPVEALRYE